VAATDRGKKVYSADGIKKELRGDRKLKNVNGSKQVVKTKVVAAFAGFRGAV
jgi:hypothetical protein